ncbi:MAG: type II toxin-antitoxin system prevent-host-death family antitoxin [Terriglobia bacterium]
MPISKFVPHLHAVIERVRRTRKPILLTRFGKPLVVIAPVPRRLLKDQPAR